MTAMSSGTAWEKFSEVYKTNPASMAVPVAYAHLLQTGKEAPVALLRTKNWVYAHRRITCKLNEQRHYNMQMVPHHTVQVMQKQQQRDLSCDSGACGMWPADR